MAAWRERMAEATRAASQRLAVRALEWAAGPRSVGIFEYKLAPRARYGWGSPAHPAMSALLQERQAESEAMLEALTSFPEDLRAIPGGRSATGVLSWDNDWWGGLDAMALYTAMRDRRPKAYVEVGSGYSTMFARRAADDHALETVITSIDPKPRAEVDGLCDLVVRRPLEEVDLGLFAQLGPGDILLIDGSHTAFMSSDSVVTCLEVLPSLAPGVLVAIDDIFLPWDYPPTWADRWYGEQYLLAVLLLSGAPGWRLRFPAWFLTQQSGTKDRFDHLWRHIAPRHGPYATSFWMERAPCP